VVQSELLSERQVEADYQLSAPWLRRARRERRGPAFLRVGKRMVRYRRADVEAFLESRVVQTGGDGVTAAA
jgi:predicted DNA-binding transcriptional regulator AlpA